MELILAITVGILYAAGVYMLLRRSMMKIIIGIVLIGQAANLLIFAVSGLERGSAPFIGASETSLSASADPLPQALVLTAIVIGFGVLAFFLVMVQQASHAVEADDLDRLKSTDS